MGLLKIATAFVLAAPLLVACDHKVETVRIGSGDIGLALAVITPKDVPAGIRQAAPGIYEVNNNDAIVSVIQNDQNVKTFFMTRGDSLDKDITADRITRLSVSDQFNKGGCCDRIDAVRVETRAGPKTCDVGLFAAKDHIVQTAVLACRP